MLLTILGGAALAAAGGLLVAAPVPAAKAPLIPTPRSVAWLAGDFVLSAHTTIVVPRSAPRDVKWAAASLGRALEERAGLKIRVAEGDTAKPPKASLTLRTGLRDAELGSEGYRLIVEPGRVVLDAAGGHGLFNGVQTLRQLINRGPKTTIAGCRVRDWPAWPYRGVLHDPARRFMTLDFLRNQIDIISSYKLNYLHLHLTDHEGWRLPIPSHPNLASEQSYTRQQFDGLVAYAKERFVTLVPEIEMPGHAGAFAKKMPHVSHGNTFCIGNEQTYAVVRDIWADTAAIFDGPYLHLGGDENKENLQCPHCRAKDQELRKAGGYQGLVPYFIGRVNKIIGSLGKQPMAWSVFTHEGAFWQGDLPKDSIVMTWKSSSVEYVRKGYRTIAVPNRPMYFTPKFLCPIEETLRWTPNEGVGGPLPGLMGAEAAVWLSQPKSKTAELALIEIGYYPRLLAATERIWGHSGEAPPTGLKEFETRLLAHRERYFSKEPFQYPPPTRYPANPEVITDAAFTVTR